MYLKRIFALLFLSVSLLYSASTQLANYFQELDNPALLQDFKPKKWFLSAQGFYSSVTKKIADTAIEKESHTGVGFTALHHVMDYVYALSFSEWVYGRAWDVRNLNSPSIGKTQGVFDFSFSFKGSKKSAFGVGYRRLRSGYFDTSQNLSWYGAKEHLLFLEKEDRFTAAWRYRAKTYRMASILALYQSQKSNTAINKQAELSLFYGKRFGVFEGELGVAFRPESLALSQTEHAYYAPRAYKVMAELRYNQKETLYGVRYAYQAQYGLDNTDMIERAHSLYGYVQRDIGKKELYIYMDVAQKIRLNTTYGQVSIGLGLGDLFD